MEKYGFSEMKGYNAQQDLLLDVQAGRVAGAISDIAGLQFSFMQMPTMHVVERIKTSDRYGIMMQKDSPNLQRVNDAITAMKQDGTLAALHKKWLGADADPGTSTVTVLEHSEGAIAVAAQPLPWGEGRVRGCDARVVGPRASDFCKATPSPGCFVATLSLWERVSR